METIYYTECDSPLGRLTLESDGRALTRIRLPEETWTPDGASRRVRRPELFAAAESQLGEYFAGTRTEFDLPLAPRGTPFQQKVWRLLAKIPHGRTTTYAELARRAGNARACRAVGAANGRNPLPIVIPCHRVIGSDGRLTGYAGGLAAKGWLLARENCQLPVRSAAGSPRAVDEPGISPECS